MKKLLILSMILVSVPAISQTPKAKAAFAPKTIVIDKDKKIEEAPCDDTKEDILKKLEEKKKEQAKANKGFSLQGGNDTGCSL